MYIHRTRCWPDRGNRRNPPMPSHGSGHYPLLAPRGLLRPGPCPNHGASLSSASPFWRSNPWSRLSRRPLGSPIPHASTQTLRRAQGRRRRRSICAESDPPPVSLRSTRLGWFLPSSPFDASARCGRMHRTFFFSWTWQRGGRSSVRAGQAASRLARNGVRKVDAAQHPVQCLWRRLADRGLGVGEHPRRRRRQRPFHHISPGRQELRQSSARRREQAPGKRTEHLRPRGRH